MTDRDLTKLKPEFKIKVDKFLAEVEGIFVTEAWRSDERQAELLKSGASQVTVSNHQLGNAIDIAFYGDDLYPSDHSKWEEVAKIANKYGMEWGYDLWAHLGFVDKPHFQDNGFPLSDENIEKQIESNEKVLSQRGDSLSYALAEYNACMKFHAELKQVPYKPLTLTS